MTKLDLLQTQQPQMENTALLKMELCTRLRNLPMKVAPQSCQKYIPSPSFNTDYLLYHSDIMLTSSFSLEVLDTLRGVCLYAETR